MRPDGRGTPAFVRRSLGALPPVSPQQSRRDFLGTIAGSVAGASAALVGLSCKSGPIIVGGFADDGGAAGHLLRDNAPLGQVRERVRVPLVIVGGGIAGLSAAWWCERQGMRDYVVLELESEAGGNSRSGRNEIGEYPWGAHYVPVPNQRATLVRTLFEELGVLANGQWNERALCFSPQERLFWRGRWHEGFEPFLLDAPDGRAEWPRFAAQLDTLRATGQFTIPLADGAPASSPLDAITLAQWLDREGYRSAALRWYADYACRDDYGTSARETSAWAGLHYFAAREHDEQGPLTWPAGNGWIVERLIERVGARVRTGAAARRVTPTRLGAVVRTATTEFTADAVVWAAPLLLAPRIIDGFTLPIDLTYAPWLVANCVLERWPADQGAAPAWDNTIVDSPGLGYVVSTHQQVARAGARTVWTYYRSFSDATPTAARQRLAQRPWHEWVEEIVADLERAHTDIRACVSRIDIRRFGHAMARPLPGFLAASWRRALGNSSGPVWYGHADLSGISIFEEAQERGIRAAQGALARLGHR